MLQSQPKDNNTKIVVGNCEKQFLNTNDGEQ